MTNVQLHTPILTGGIWSANFFNGRMLSAEDLRLEKKANKDARGLLGHAIGDGVAYGLEVKEAIGQSTKQAPVLTVSEGLAVNREGQPLLLQPAIDVVLVRPAQTSGPAVNALFADCQPLQQGPNVVGKGVYLLTIQAASGTEGRAAVSGLGNLEAACNAKYQIDGVQFRLIQLPITPTELSDAAHLRNHMAYRCFGLNDNAVTSFITNPFGPVVTKYGLLDELRPNCLLDSEVPLALLFWTAANGIEFIDMWSVRRRITRRAADTDLPLLVTDRRMAEGEAMFLQFQEQLDGLRLAGQNLSAMVGNTRFNHLPPVGVLPIQVSGVSTGFNYQIFFQGVTYREPVYIEGARVRSIIQEGLDYPPIKLTSKEMIWLYLVRENGQAADLNIQNPPQVYLIFTNGHMPFHGEARYDLSRWNYNNYV